MSMQEVRSTTTAKKDTVVHRSPSGRTIVFKTGPCDELSVVGSEGQIELRVRFTEQGPVLTMSAARVELESAGSISLDCEDLELRARRSMSLSAGGELVQEAGGEIRVETKSDMWLTGSMILMNSDRETEMAERARNAALEREAAEEDHRER